MVGNRKLILVSVAAVAMLMMGTTAAAPAVAAEGTPVSPDDRAALAFWERYGATPSQLVALERKLKDDKPTMNREVGIRPTHVENVREDGFDRRIEKFADGSVTVTSVQIESGFVADPTSPSELPIVTPQSAVGVTTLKTTGGTIGGCSYSSGTGYTTATNCLVTGTDGQITMFFRANYQRLAQTYGGRITWAGAQGQSCSWPFTCGHPSQDVWRPNQNSGGPAQVSYGTDISAALGSNTGILSLYVNSSSAWANIQINW